ncbi:MAG: TolC family protein [Proteobacteria bacterium]|nr:hypothetical protein [Desulfobacula sp.]MBU3954755.1 TolC family protein [Pseudomonadota bacterium]MBU4129964.1 TolC family protein [Pseudomonadota bacterium]
MYPYICRSILIILFISLFSLTAFGQDTTKSPEASAFNPDIRQLLTGLLENHEEIKTFRHRVESAQALLRQSQGLYYPRLDLYGDAGYEKIEKQYGVKNSEEDRHSVTLRGTQLITDFGKTTHTIGRDQTFLEQAQARLDAISQQMIRDGIVAYINIVRARERLKIANRSEGRIKEVTGIEKALVKKGAGLSSDVLQAKSQLAGAMAIRVEAAGELEMAKNKFHSIFYHYPTADEIEMFREIANPDAFIPDNLENAIATAMEHNPEIKITTYDVNVTQKDIKISKSSYYPTLSLYGEAVNAHDNDGQAGYRRDYSAGVEFSYNLYSGGSDKAAIMAALANNNAAATHLGFAKKLVTEQVRNSWELLMTLTQRNELLDQQADILKNFLELAKKERKMGTRSLLDVLNGEVNYINAQGNAIAAREDTKNAAFNLLFSMGRMNIDLLAQ